MKNPTLTCQKLVGLRHTLIYINKTGEVEVEVTLGVLYVINATIQMQMHC